MCADAQKSSVAEKWTILRAGIQDAGGLEIPSIPLSVATDAGPIRLATGPRGEAKLLLPLLSREKYIEIDAGDKLRVTVSFLLYGGKVNRFLDLTCDSDELQPVFCNVVEEIITRVSLGVSCLEAARKTLNDYRQLLSGKRSQRVDINRVAGLVAELLVLNELLRLSPLAGRAWKGPLGNRHDFRSADTSLEVKASMRAETSIITIHGLRQMEPPSGGALYLLHFILEPVANGLMTVADLGRRALALADDPATLQAALEKMGCPDVNDPSWNQDAFRVEQQVLYRVNESFPRLIPTAFVGGAAPEGIRDVTYQSDLSLATGFQCSINEFENLLQVLAR